MFSRFRIRLAWLLLIPYWIALAVSTHAPPGSVKSLNNRDKLLHFAAFAGLSFLLAWSLPARLRRVRVYFGILIAAAIYGALDEWTQGFIRGRTPDPWDWLADICGATTGLASFIVVAALLARLMPAIVSTPALKSDTES